MQAPGETWVMCQDCGARLFSEDNGTEHRGTRGVKCPYKRDIHRNCKTPEEMPELYMD